MHFLSLITLSEEMKKMHYDLYQNILPDLLTLNIRIRIRNTCFTAPNQSPRNGIYIKTIYKQEQQKQNKNTKMYTLIEYIHIYSVTNDAN